jgi:transitional endoplasmic reticulum ATPase
MRKVRNTRRSVRASPSTDVPPLVRLWILRILVPLRGDRHFIEEKGAVQASLAEAIGMRTCGKGDSTDFDAKATAAELRRLHRIAERELENVGPPARLACNVGRLAELIGLSDVDEAILTFAILIRQERCLDIAADCLGPLSTSRLTRALELVLGVPDGGVGAALSAGGVLVRSGLVSVDHRSNFMLGKLDLLSDRVAAHLAASEGDPLECLRGTVCAASPAGLSLDDYPHIAASLNVLMPYLGQALATGRAGVNVLLYGAPGTGKSELARAIASAMGFPLLEVASESDEGTPISGEKRLRALRAAQVCFARRKVLVLFDEVEDVFDDHGQWSGGRSTGQIHKGWINRMLEGNPVPVLWLSNAVACLDPAFVRRFDMVLELPIPPARQRAAILRRTCGDLLASPDLARIAACDALAPALATRAAGVVRAIRDTLPVQETGSAFELLVSNTLEAQGHRRVARDDPAGLPALYDPAFVQADADLVALEEGLVRTQAGRLCMYGPPGTGKTAWGRWLAERMGARLHLERASGLISKWVGESEQNVARAFRKAEQDRAVLLFDEVDSFLQDRSGSRAFWEATLVNEMLTQMESFPGVFIATTNLFDALDPAALRRFDVKVGFGYLAVDQAWKLFCRHCSALGLGQPSVRLRSPLARLATLTPGDFAAVARRHRFHPLRSPAQVLEALAAECAVKPGAKRRIGFI